MAKKLYKVTHVMADGTELNDITGYVIPAGHQVYNILKSINEKAKEQTAWNYLIGFLQKNKSKRLVN